ncbi:MAG: hypothetical protein LBH71_02195, partial [Oscillospiraceae bacterium]|nr:hypothetical protein [Oscillospiraceae bacterium]
MNEKVKVFISSLCDDDKYRVARNSLKLLLEKTNMVDTYVFELSGGSSRAVVPEYLSKLEDSDLCIFI